MSQSQELKTILEDHQWHCSSEIVEKMYIVDYRARFNDMRKKGIKIDSQPCSKIGCPRSHKGSSHSYRLLSPQRSDPYFKKPEEGQLRLVLAPGGSSAYRRS